MYLNQQSILEDPKEGFKWFLSANLTPLDNGKNSSNF